MTSPRRSSSSLFDHDDASHSLEKAQAKLLEEKRRRLRLFRRIGLPLCIIGGLLVVFFMKDVLISLFKEDHMIQQYIAEEEARTQEAKKSPESPVTIREFGRPSAGMKIEFFYGGERHGAEEIEAVLLEAVDMKPSEIFLRLDNRHEAGISFKIDGRSEFAIPGKDGKKSIVLANGVFPDELRTILNQVHREIYGANVLCPLNLTATAAELKQKAEVEKAMLPDFVSSKKDLKDHSRQTLLILPKADTDVIPAGFKKK